MHAWKVLCAQGQNYYYVHNNVQCAEIMEFRVNIASSGDKGTVNSVEVCIDDQWHDSITKIITNNSSSPQNISIQNNSTSMIVFS